MALARVLLADDYPGVLNKVTQLLGGDFDIVGTAHDGRQALEAATRLNPDLLILDISMPILSGIQVAAQLRDSSCQAKVIFLTVHEDRDYIDAAFAVGALGYVLKSRVGTDLLAAIYAVLQGHRFTSPLESFVLR
ncbi:MAG TPA: response regulator transcription factor [Terriglobales bacterium]|jgi:DNA-binding NarL/FixJ family response regulator|nr:response regulator transcription factor [Terriglobales bacterium]